MQTTRMTAVALAVLALTAASPAVADVSPGDKITDQNLDKVKDLISPGLEWCIKHGFPITIGETKRVEWPRAYKEATEKYSSQVKLSPDGRSMTNYVAGQPFPNVDPKDPQFVLKIMYNYDYGYVNGLDDTDLRNFDADTGSIADHGPMTVERHFLLDHFRRLFWTGRLYVDPKPEKPNPNGYRAQQGLYPILEPFDLKGVGALGNRYVSPDKQDDSWLYLPSLRRVRRLSTAQRSDALFGQDTDVDSYYGYAGQVGWMDWKYLGERDILGIIHAEHYPVKWHEKVDWAMDEKWEKRRVYVLEGISKLPQYAYGKRVLFIDKEAFVVAYSDIYDRNNELWKVWIDNHQFRTQAFPGAPTKYDEEKDFYAGLAMVDMQLMHATYVPHPGEKPPGHEGWYFNKGTESATKYKPGGAVPDSFTVAKLIEQGQ